MQMGIERAKQHGSCIVALANAHHIGRIGAWGITGVGVPATIIRALTVISLLMFAKFIYIGAFTNYFTFYLMSKFHLSVQHAQAHLFLFLFAAAIVAIAPLGTSYQGLAAKSRYRSIPILASARQKSFPVSFHASSIT